MEDLSRYDPLPFERRVADRQSRLPTLRPHPITANAMMQDMNLEAANKRINNFAVYGLEVENVVEELKDTVMNNTEEFTRRSGNLEDDNVTFYLSMAYNESELRELRRVRHLLGVCEKLLANT